MTAHAPDQAECAASLVPFAGMETRERWDRADVLAFQQQMLDACRAYAYAHSPFYQRFHAGLMDSPLHTLPVLTKALMLEQFDALVTDREIRLADVRAYLAAPTGRYLDRYQVMATSGSTGQPTLLLYGMPELGVVVQSFSRSLRMGGVTPTSRAAVVTSTAPTHMSARAPVIVQGQDVARIQLSATQPMAELVEQLNDWQPDTMLWYGSIARALAEEQQQGRLRIAPTSMLCSAESLSPETRQRLSETWNGQVFDIYATTESGVLAAECAAHAGLHLFEDLSIVEVVDADNQPVPPGAVGEKVLLTVLFRRTQPLIRYEITDLVQPADLGVCSCGMPFARIRGIQGRQADVLELPRADGTLVRIFPYLFTTIFNTLPLGGWQIIATPEGLHIHLQDADPLLTNAPVREALHAALRARGVAMPPITIHRNVALIRNAAGKAPLVLRQPHYAPPAGAHQERP